MIKFPNSECYLVTYSAGAYGGILTTLVSSLVLDDEDLKKVEIAPSANGNSHYGFVLAQQTWSPMSKMLFALGNDGHGLDDGSASVRAIIYQSGPTVRQSTMCQWEIAEPKDSVIVMYDHVPVKSYDMLSTIYPNFKQITISYCEGDLQQIELNLFRKIIVDEWEYRPMDRLDYLKMRGDMLIKYPTETWLNNYDDARDLASNSEDFKKFIKLQWPKPDSYSIKTDVGTFKYIGPSMFNESFLEKKARKHKDQIYYIQFNDVIINPEKVLDQLSSITNRPIKDITRTMYDAWLSKQKLIEDLRDT